MREQLVYLVTNSVNGKVYVGITEQSLKTRWSRHLSDARNGSGFLLHRAIRKYGASAFTVDILARLDSREDAFWVETIAITAFNSLAPNGYNLTTGGDGPNALSEQSRLLRAEITRQRWQDTAWRKSFSAKMKEVWANEEYRQTTVRKMSLSWNEDRKQQLTNELKEKWSDPEYRDKKSQAAREQMSDNWKDEDWRKMMSQASRERLSGMWADEQYRERFLQALSDRMSLLWQDESFRDRISQLAKQRWENEDYRKLLSSYSSQRMTRRWQNPEFAQGVSDRLKEKWKDEKYREHQLQLSRQRMLNRWADKEFAAKHSGGAHPNARAVIVHGQRYETLTAAAAALGKGTTTIGRWVKKKTFAFYEDELNQPTEG